MGRIRVVVYLYRAEIYGRGMRVIGRGFGRGWVRVGSGMGGIMIGFILEVRGV